MSKTSLPRGEQELKPVDGAARPPDLERAETDTPPPPDGGWEAWLVVAGSFGLTMTSGGYFVAWGTFQAFYEQTYLETSNSSAIAWIGSIQYALIFLPGLISGRLFDLGYFKPVLISTTIASAVANFMIAECRVYYQFLLAQGILLGVCAGLTKIPCVALVSHWFDRKRPLVLSIVSMASATGGVIYPIMFRQLQSVMGFQWTMRTFALFNMFFCIFAIFTMKTRHPPSKKLPKLFALGDVIKSPAYVAYVFGNFLGYLGLFTPSTFMTVEAEAIGFTPSLAFYMVSITNGVTIIGRFVFGELAIKFGSLNLTIISTIFVMALTYGWGFVTSIPGYIVVSCAYGIASGGFLGLFTMPLAQMGPVRDVGKLIGFQMTIMSFGAILGPPISGAIRDTHADYHLVSIYAGTMLLASIFFMALSKHLHLGTVFTEKF